MASGPITPDRLTEYRQAGYTLVRRMFNSQEIDLLRRSAKQDKTLDDHAFGRDDGRGNIVRLSLWNHPIYGMFARCESIVNSAERILEGEVYHYHSKMIMKDAKTGSAWPGIRTTVIGIRMVSSPRCLQRIHCCRSSHSRKRLRLGSSIQPPRPGFTKSTGGNAMFNFGTVGTLNCQQKPNACCNRRGPLYRPQSRRVFYPKQWREVSSRIRLHQAARFALGLLYLTCDSFVY
jgi:hypothetical protein